MSEQPLPLPCPGVMGAHDLMIADLDLASPPEPVYAAARLRILDRRQVGLDRYGQLLCPNNRRDTLRDALEEALDLCAYLRNLLRLGCDLETTYRAAYRVFLDLVVEQAKLHDVDLSCFGGITLLAAEPIEEDVHG